MASQFIQESIESHNKLRAEHGCPPLVHAQDLSDFAQKWADQIAATGRFQHSDAKLNGVKLGENIAMRWSSGGADYDGDGATNQWYSEIGVHDFSSEPRSLASGHFTQVIWKASREAGFGKAKSKDGKCFVVGSYRPAGNLIGSFVENVPPRKDGKIPTKEELTKSTKPESPKMTRMTFGGDSPRMSSGSGASGGKRTFTRTVTRTGPDGKTQTVTETFEDDAVPEDSKFDSFFSRQDFGFGKDFGDFGNRLNLRSDSGFSAGFPTRSGIGSGSGIGIGSGSDLMGGKLSKGSGGSGAPGDCAQPHEDFDAQCLQAHNEYRAKHGAEALKMASDLTAHAQAWADKLAKENKFAHSKCTLEGGERIGENIAMKWMWGSTARYTGQQIVDQWYAEEQDYDYSGTGDVIKAGHFTQVVWKGSQELGIGKAIDKDGKILNVVCNYRPAGNIMGAFVDNVESKTEE